MDLSSKIADKKAVIYLVLFPFICLTILSCAAKVKKDDELQALWNVMEAKMPRWIEFSRKMDPGFELSNFYLEKSGALTPITEYSFTKYSPKDLDSIYSKYYYIYSPDSTKFLDIYSATAELSIEHDTIKAWFQPDVAAILFDLKNGKESVYISCGTYCGLNEAVWIDNDSFIITGYTQTEQNPPIHSTPIFSNAFITYINLKENISKRYLSTRPIRHSASYYALKFPKFVQ